ncbi:nucleotidyltransferase domain-containing protein [Nocardioides bruguierae]|uniref:Nucleotidyltransferase domain-containing protein n=1 Tax=Nocardioides bruguierae TaxID=2945102 RepID=A0A9X2DAP2_9ACTN|nr:nucleotidyltransferase domain-containing protein [Nocardioides bruguierae]MCM0622453.1 nucleotidyltransferase domain-containing protein [Nocardioides bruguierae]
MTVAFGPVERCDVGGDEYKWVLERLHGDQSTVLLYGSRARGDARADSDIDVLQVVETNPHCYSVDNINVAAYTFGHLEQLASRGSLYMRHLKYEAVILRDDDGLTKDIFAMYRDPRDYAALRRELAIVVSVLGIDGSRRGEPSESRVYAYVLRTLIYAECAMRGEIEFDVVRAANSVDLPNVGLSIREKTVTYEMFDTFSKIMLDRAGVLPPKVKPRTFGEAVLWTGVEHPLAGALLESFAGAVGELEYTALTLPLA